MSAVPGSGIVDRFVRAARLDRAVFAEVGADRGATVQAGLVVIFGGACNALGQGRELGWFGASPSLAAVMLTWILWTVAGPAVAWVLWTLVVGLIGRAFGHAAADQRALFRALGFANAPTVAMVLRIVPVVGFAVYYAVILWLLAATATAVEAVFVISRRRAVVITALAFMAYWLVGLGLQIWAAG